ncbi:hypothetical protein ACQUQU_01080 [Thalassolituus sp. LLYu03]|uniref:hypothetical protein n=1 Tax=Thalassolituus sp. LLYu03 TaxID=3421656 RepID=UPI003D2E282E
MKKRFCAVALLCSVSVGCANLTAWQLNDLDQTAMAGQRVTPVEIRLSEGAVDTVAISDAARATGDSKLGLAALLVATAVSLSTADGRVVTRSELSGGVDWKALQESLCPDGTLTNFRAVNEYYDYLFYQSFKFGFDADCIHSEQAADAGAQL